MSDDDKQELRALFDAWLAEALEAGRLSGYTRPAPADDFAPALPIYYALGGGPEPA